MNLPVYKERIQRKLVAAFAPFHVEVSDNSARHKGHAGHDPKGETHFKVKIISAAFSGLSRVARHRLIYAALADELKERVHALNIEALTPDKSQL